MTVDCDVTQAGLAAFAQLLANPYFFDSLLAIAEAQTRNLSYLTRFFLFA